MVAINNNLRAFLTNNNTVSINRVTWNPDGTPFGNIDNLSFFQLHALASIALLYVRPASLSWDLHIGVAYSKHIVQIYSYHGGDDLRNHPEIEAHGGPVNDLAFSYPNKQLCIVTCGEDILIKVGHRVFAAAITSRYLGSLKDTDRQSDDLESLLCLLTSKNGKRRNFVYYETSDNDIKILANPDGIRLLRTMENRPFDASRVASTSVVMTPMMSMFGAANTSMGQSIMDKFAPMPSIVVMNCDNRSQIDVNP
ncbi:hypothetical protein OSB04_un000977 [Centaurea solstitialis]|uniref:Uncharacterized protein n=1 Tax=Centaurea solstitialis TaxID=347529 RepID=A0AA38SBK6_9ASTR|nr:hypothetical protein OSB04_un000977 [Centaurea solstitialis]